MPRLDTLRSRLPFAGPALLAVLALAPACGDSGTTSVTEAATTTGETTTTTSPTTTAPATTGTGTTDGSSTTGDPAVCDGSMASNAFECSACTECGTWITPVMGPEYPAALVCMLEGLRDDRVVGGGTQSCDFGKCLNDRLLSTGMGTFLGQQMIFDENDQSMNYLSIQELQFKEPAYFETCLAAYDETCTSPNSWVIGDSVNIDSLVCP